jgi:type III pantothenate kinase
MFPFRITLLTENMSMWLLLDIGNSSVKVGLYDRFAAERGAPISVRRIEYGKDADMDAEAILVEWVGTTPLEKAGGVSVVPSQSLNWAELIERLFGLNIDFFNESSNMPFDLTYQTPTTLGNDRIAVAVGGWTRFGNQGKNGVIVVDAGTAINYEVIRASGEYPGGVIAPGPGLVRQALGVGTAQLPSVELECPSGRIGRSTDEAIRSGIMYGLLDSVVAMIDGLQAEERRRLSSLDQGGSIDKPATSMLLPYEVVFTGGWGKWLSEKTGYRFEDHLVLKGVSDLMRRSAQ